MTRNGKYIERYKILDSFKFGQCAQVGYDLSVRKVEELNTGLTPATFNAKSKLSLPDDYKEVPLYDDHCWHLSPHSVYYITFDQGIRALGKNEFGLIMQRSSLNRVGVRVTGSVYDPGYYVLEEQGLGATMYTGSLHCVIPQHCRIAQLLIFDSEDVENLYKGTWQNRN